MSLRQSRETEDRAAGRVITAHHSAEVKGSAGIVQDKPCLEPVLTETELSLALNAKAEGPDGPTWVRLSESLARYAISVLLVWIRTGRMHDQCRRRGMRLSHGWLPLEDSDAQELVNLTVAYGLRRFRERSLVQGKWRTDGGASLGSWFVNDCILEYPNIWRSWVRTEERWRRVHDNLGWQNGTQAIVDPQVREVERWQVIDTLARIEDGSTRAIAALLIDGYSLQEIGQILGLSGRAVEGRLYRLRRRVREEGARTVTLAD
jgi:hypothetical protein